MTKIFVSYKRKNKEQVFSIVQNIEEQLGIKCWVDLDGIESSAQFASKICKAIDMAEVVLFMHSSVHLNIDFENDWTIKELNYAQAKKKKVVMVKLDSSPLDNIFLMEYGTKNNIDSRDDTQFQKLLKDLGIWLTLSQPKKSVPAKTHIHKNNELPSHNHAINEHLSVIKETELNKTTPEEMNLCTTYIDMVIHRKLKVLEVRKQIEALAMKGKTEAEYALGFGEYYPYGTNIRIGGDSHYRNAELWLEKAAKKGHIKAQATLAEMYYWGKELEKAIPWAMSASKNNLKAALILAWCYRNLNDNMNYIDALKKASKLQKAFKDRIIHCPAMEYGKILLEGKLVSKNLNEAIQWFDTAIDLANDLQKKSEAIYYKGRALYEQGNKLKALLCLEKSPGQEYGYVSKYSIPELQNKIMSELNPFSKLFKMKE